MDRIFIMDKTAIMGEEPVTFAVITILMMLCAYLSGQTMAKNWRKMGKVIFFAIIVVIGHRFLLTTLRNAEFLNIYGIAMSTGIMFTVAILTYLRDRAKKMVNQYPWELKKKGLFGWSKIEQ
uniref:DUF6867 domain-containing protein n=1 Tax=OCS116 cluster bacterium TaxID=2030921 RepID=A0A2A4Z563_9PROT